MMMTAMMETTALELRPWMASAGVITPDRGSSTIIINPTMSTRTFSVTKSRVTRMRNPKTMVISGVMPAGRMWDR